MKYITQGDFNKVNKVPVDIKKAKKYAFQLRLREVFSDGLLTAVKLNFFFLLTSIPLVTIGPSMAALANCTNLHVTDDRVQFATTKAYFASFKAAFKRTMPVGIAVALLTAFFGFGLHMYIQMMGQNIMFVPLASLSLVALVVLWAVTVHLMPLFFEDTDFDSKPLTVTVTDKSTKELVSTAIRTALITAKKTVICLVIAAVMVGLQLLFMPLTIPIVLIIGIGLPAQVCAFCHTEPEILDM